MVTPLLPATFALAILVAAVVGLRMAYDPGAIADRRADGGSSESSSGQPSRLGARFDHLAIRLSPIGLRFANPAYRLRLRHQLLLAGSPRRLTVDELLGRKVLTFILSIGYALGMLSFGQPLLALGALALGAVWQDLWLAQLGRARRAAVEREFPDLVDVLAVTLSAGLAFRPGLGRVTALTDGPLAEEFAITLREIDFGVPRRKAFENLRYRNEKSVQVTDFVSGVLQAEELGSPLVEAIISLSDDARRAQEQSLRQRAGKAENNLVLASTLTFLPILLVLMLTTIFLPSIDDFATFFESATPND